MDDDEVHVSPSQQDLDSTLTLTPTSCMIFHDHLASLVLCKMGIELTLEQLRG